MIASAQYAWLTVKHKVFVFRAGLKTGAPLWRLVIHDWSKFTPAELPHYGRQFFGDKSDPAGFAKAWLHHQNHNPHHWEYWIPRTGHNRGGVDTQNGSYEMPEWAVREMIADWMGASRAYEGRWPRSLYSWNWWMSNWKSVSARMHPKTAELTLKLLKELL